MQSRHLVTCFGLVLLLQSAMGSRRRALQDRGGGPKSGGGELPQYESARKSLQLEVEERERSLRQQQEEITELKSKLERDGELMSQSEMQRLQNDIRSRTRKLKYAQDEFQEDLSLRQNELRTKLARQVQEVVVELAKELEIDLVLSEGLVYYSPRVDISDQVIERLKREFSSK